MTVSGEEVCTEKLSKGEGTKENLEIKSCGGVGNKKMAKGEGQRERRRKEELGGWQGRKTK